MAGKKSSIGDRNGQSGVVSGEAQPVWTQLTQEKLLDVRLCDLGLRIEGTDLASLTRHLLSELKQHRIALRPHFWLSEEWFVPDGVPGIAIPFYLAHAKLKELQKKQMLEVDGNSPLGCIRIMRHEAGHAVENAYRLRRKKSWQKVFGKASQPYPESYLPKPYSRKFVQHLAAWYAQSHPTEDFAETFAVWLTPDSDWRTRYRGWPALKKLEYVDALMVDLADTPPRVSVRIQVEPIRYNRKTLREYFDEKKAWYGVDCPEVYDRDLRRVFSDLPDHAGNSPASAFLRQIRPELRRWVAAGTGAYRYNIDQVLKQMIQRCRVLKLRLRNGQEQTRMDATILLTVETMKFLHDDLHRIIL